MSTAPRWKRWKKLNGNLTGSIKFREKNPHFYPYWKGKRNDSNRASAVALSYLGILAIMVGFMGWVLFKPSDASDTTTSNGDSISADFSSVDASEVLDLRFTATPTQNIVEFNQPVVTPTVAPSQDFAQLQAVQATATAIAETFSDLSRGAVAINAPSIQVTPADGRWVWGWYPVAYCPTGYEDECSRTYNGAPRVQVPQDYGCDLYGCGYGRHEQ